MTEAPRANILYQPVIDNPTGWDTIKNIRPSGWLATAAWTGLGFVGGYILGKPGRGAIATIGAGGCLIGGFFSNFVLSYQRLVGYSENSRELKKYGIQKKELVEVVRKRDIRTREELFK
jgi:hypothetical protein